MASLLARLRPKSHTDEVPPTDGPVSPLDQIAYWFFQHWHVRRGPAPTVRRHGQAWPMTRCPRCGEPHDSDPAYCNRGEYLHQKINTFAMCQACFDALGPEGFYQWLLMNQAAWMQHYRGNPISYDPPHPQARYRETSHQIEQWRRILFEPLDAVDGFPSFGPNYKPYQRCYQNLGGLASAHTWHEIPELSLAICTTCRAWARLPEYDLCEPWISNEGPKRMDTAV